MKPSHRHFAASLVLVTLAGVTAGRADTFRIVIDRLVFSPETTTAKVGDTIEWVNRDALAHTATAKGDWDVMLPAGKTTTLVLTKAGAVEYFCRFHPNMKGRLDVLGK